MTPDIPKTRAERIALRDRLNALIDTPGADPSPMHCRTRPEDTIEAYVYGYEPDVIFVTMRQADRAAQHTFNPEDARRFADRLRYLADNAA
jgi:hypothetical protein